MHEAESIDQYRTPTTSHETYARPRTVHEAAIYAKAQILRKQSCSLHEAANSTRFRLGTTIPAVLSSGCSYGLGDEVGDRHRGGFALRVDRDGDEVRVRDGAAQAPEMKKQGGASRLEIVPRAATLEIVRDRSRSFEVT